MWESAGKLLDRLFFAESITIALSTMKLGR